MEIISRRKFRKKQKQADRNISKILNTNNAFKRRQKEIIDSIFNK